ncbi:exosortase/archaeosortase family protein [uncultured Thiodictyon sp.]|uniref:exosortase/archaeosortase family protein n=2 Tax=uncultured Thiodictyon sp. TaxID=1846217 RepID=UPI0025DAE7B8|nr:exosortase/archaeosortase family protein [uncultured Thiodictyon sp.]
MIPEPPVKGQSLLQQAKHLWSALRTFGATAPVAAGQIGSVVRTVLLLAVMFLLLHFAHLTEVLSALTRPLVTGAAAAFGIAAVDRGKDIVLGQLVIPWTQDCSGVNTLIILWGVTLWANHKRAFDGVLLGRLLLCVPVAVLVNMLRIATLAGYRYVFYPAWEGEELHYLIGFLWIVPFLILFIDDLQQMDRTRWLEVIYLSLVLALVAVPIFSPGGHLIALSALFFLAHSRLADAPAARLGVAYLVWGLAAVVIAWSSMESLWIPWLLVCPRLVSWRLLSSVSGLIILSGTVSLLAMWPQWQAVVAVVLCYRVYLILLGGSPQEARPAPIPLGGAEAALLAFLGMAPFVLPPLVAIDYKVEPPPAGVVAQQIASNGYQLQLDGQPTSIRMYWYGAFDQGRHHSLISCMRFRGLTLETVRGQEEVLTGGGLWMREFFIHRGKLQAGYRSYLLSSFLPFTGAGNHIILDAPEAAMSAAEFSQESEQLAAAVFAAYRGP